MDTRARVPSRPRRGWRPPVMNARLTPASVANSAAEWPANSRHSRDASPVASDTAGSTCTAIMPTSANPRATSTPMIRRRVRRPSALVTLRVTAPCRGAVVERGGAVTTGVAAVHSSLSAAVRPSSPRSPSHTSRGERGPGWGRCPGGRSPSGTVSCRLCWVIR